MTRKQLCKNQMLAKKADLDKIYLPYQEGERSLKNLEKEYKATIIGLQTYMSNKNEVQIKAGTSSSKEPLTDAECAMPIQKLWNISYQYHYRHNQVAAQLHLDIYKPDGIKVEAECWYQHKPE